MKKYYWFGVGALLGLVQVVFVYVFFNLLVINGKPNPFSAIGMVVVYSAVIYLFGKIYDRLKS